MFLVLSKCEREWRQMNTLHYIYDARCSNEMRCSFNKNERSVRCK